MPFREPSWLPIFFAETPAIQRRRVLARRREALIQATPRLREECSPVAQLVEQVTVNHRVGGSSPSRGATLANFLDIVGELSAVRAFVVRLADAPHPVLRTTFSRKGRRRTVSSTLLPLPLRERVAHMRRVRGWRAAPARTSPPTAHPACAPRRRSAGAGRRRAGCGVRWPGRVHRCRRRPGGRLRRGGRRSGSCRARPSGRDR